MAMSESRGHRGGALVRTNALAADLLEREPRVPRYRIEELLGGHAAGEHLQVEANQGGDVSKHLPLGAALTGLGDGRAQALDAPVGVLATLPSFSG